MSGIATEQNKINNNSNNNKNINVDGDNREKKFEVSVDDGIEKSDIIKSKTKS